jgi:hypothetical protein
MARHTLVALWLGGATMAAFAQAPAKPPSGPLLDSKHLLLQVEQLAPSENVGIFSDPARAGIYITRTQLAASAMARPHYRDQDRWVTVLKGTWWVGQGDVYRTEKLVPVREGGMMYQPANLRTYDVAGASEVILQIVGVGPVKSTHAEVDAKGQPVPVGGPYPEQATGETGRGRGRGGRRGQPPQQ